MYARTRAGSIAPSPPKAASSPTFTPSSFTAYCLRVASIVSVGMIETPVRVALDDEPPVARRADDEEVARCAASSTKSFSPLSDVAAVGTPRARA